MKRWMLIQVLRIFALLLLTGQVLMAPVSAATDIQKPRIAVLPVENATGDAGLDALEDGFSDVLVAALSNLEGVTVVGRDELSSIVSELARGLSGQAASDSAARLGKLTGANILVKGSFTLQDKRIAVVVHAYQLETTRLLASAQSSNKLSELATLGETLASKLVARLTRSEGLDAVLPVDRHPQINLHFMKGLGFYYNQLYDHAIAEFMLVSYLQPAHGEAAYWTAKSYYDSGDFEHARVELSAFLRDFVKHPKTKTAARLLRSLGKED
jgi:TolB-like protein